MIAVTRRSFVAAAAVAPAVAAEGAIWRNRQAGMRYRRLGRTGMMISEVVFGTQRVKPGAAAEVETAIEMGLNYLDTAPAYGNGQSERGLASVIAGAKRDKVFVTTKISPWIYARHAAFQKIFAGLDEGEQKRLTAAAGEAMRARRALDPHYFGGFFPGQKKHYDATMLCNVMEKKYGGRIDRKMYRDVVLESAAASFQRLGADHVDVLICPHAASTREELTDFPEILEAFEILRKQGRARWLGVSAHTDPAAVLEGAAANGSYAMAQVAYNVLNHPYVDGAMETAHRAGMGIIAMKAARPLYSGGLANDQGYAVTPDRLQKLHAAVPGDLPVPLKAYSWALRDPRVAAVNSEMTTVEIVRQNLTTLARA